jgi:hypothetical protein
LNWPAITPTVNHEQEILNVDDSIFVDIFLDIFSTNVVNDGEQIRGVDESIYDYVCFTTSLPNYLA